MDQQHKSRRQFSKQFKAETDSLIRAFARWIVDVLTGDVSVAAVSVLFSDAGRHCKDQARSFC